MINVSMMLFDRIFQLYLDANNEFDEDGDDDGDGDAFYYYYLIYVTILIQHLPLDTWQFDKSKILGMVQVLMSRVSNQ